MQQVEDTKPSERSRAKRSPKGVRWIFVLIHRYVGLLMATFLIVAGLTGSLIAFNNELDAWVSPELLRATPLPGQAILDPFTLREVVQAQLPGKVLDSVVLNQDPTRTVDFWVDGKEFFVDPYTGKIVGSRTWGDISEGLKNLIPFIYNLHFSLALDDVGIWIFGIVGVLWTVDCFVGAYLTFPQRTHSKARSKPSVWLRSWAPAWLLKTNKLFAFVFTWHRASGLWLWFFFLVFAWSGVALNLHDEVYAPVMSLVVEEPKSVWESIPELTQPKPTPDLDVRAAYEVGQRLMSEQAKVHNFRVLTERWLSYDADHGVYSFWVESTLDVSEQLGETHVIFDGDSGNFRGFSARAGLHAGDTIMTWLVALHFGSVRLGGLPYRIFVSILGLVVVALSVTGVWIWWRKSSRVKNTKASVAA